MNDSMNPKPTAEQLKTWDRTLVWHAFTQMAEYEPLVIERAEGCTLFDIDGNAYLDGVSSLWCNIHGHRHPRLDAALRAQLDRVAHVTNLGSSNPTTIRLARRLVDLAPAGLGHVFFSDDGATAVEVALKMAFQYWRQRRDPRPEKTCYLALGDAYHGDTLGSVSVGGVERFHAMFRPLLFETLRLPMPDTYRTPAGVLPARAGRVSPGETGAGAPRGTSPDCRHGDRALGPGRGRHDDAPGRLSPRRAGIDPQVRRAADCRRGGRGLRPHGADVRLRARAGRARLALPGQGADGRLLAPGRHAGERGDSGRRSWANMPRAGRSSTATPTGATRWGRRSRWPRWRSSRKSRPWPGCRRRSTACPGTCGGSPPCRTWATSASAG